MTPRGGSYFQQMGVQMGGRADFDSRFSHSDSLPGVLVFHHRFSGELCTPMLSHCFIIWQLLAGGNDQWYRGKTHAVLPGAAHIIQPGEMFKAVRRHGLETLDLSLIIRPDVFQRAARSVLGADAASLVFSSFRLPSADVAAHARELAFAIRAGESRLDLETKLDALVALVLREDKAAVPDAPRRDKLRSSQVRDYLLEHFAENVTLDALEAATGMSRFYLARLFKEEYGVPPHLYLIHLRIAKAQQLIETGLPLSQLAPEVGFTDQSHLTRHFKRYVGMTPGEYARVFATSPVSVP